MAISLFWLLIAVLIHLLLEIISQKRQKSSWPGVLLESLWETKLDFALVVFALWLAVYLDFIFGVAGIGAAARTGAHAAARTGNIAGRAAQVPARFAAWNRTIRAIMLSLDDVANAMRFLYQGRKNKVQKLPDSIEAGNQATVQSPTPNATKKAAPVQENPESGKTSWNGKWKVIDYTGVLLFAVFMLLIIFAPVITGHSFTDILQIILKEFHPFPS